MKSNLVRNRIAATAAAALISVLVLGPTPAAAHCDTMDGPVVADARRALESGDPTPVLKWVREEDAGEIRGAFDLARTVRAKGDDAKRLADRSFFETLVRVHRASEGAPYTGLKPAGSVEPPIAAADQALEKGSVDDLAEKIGAAAAAGVKKRFAHVMETRAKAEESVEAGRAYVRAYVEYVHYVEGLHETITAGASHDHR